MSKKVKCLLLAITASVIVVDQQIKNHVASSSLPFIINSGGILGFLTNTIFMNQIQIFLVLSFLVYLMVVMKKVDNVTQVIAFAMISGAGISNLWDRIKKGGVVDYLDFGEGPMFNVADIFLFLGIVMFMAGSISIFKATSRKKSNIS